MTKRIELPPPEMWLLTRHDDYSFAHELEKYIRYYEVNEDTGLEREVALPMEWVRNLMLYRDSRMPRCSSICTTPLVLRNGTLLATHGLDRKRSILFILQDELLAALPRLEDCNNAAVKKAMAFLTDEWLVDVLTNHAGKCTLIAAALSILERTLLPERPAFFVTAGKRGGGKTTALHMVVMAATGHAMPAAAWSYSEEERRKALFSYLSEGVPAVAWDNIPKGTKISSAAIEKSLTSLLMSDRILKELRFGVVPATTINFFSGNNVGPKGDMASRSLIARLEVRRSDPENRPVVHEDPLHWTLRWRGNILCALYAILMANPRLRQRPNEREAAQTRFKTWWHLVGSAVEHASAVSGEEISFRALLSQNEVNDEQDAALVALLRRLQSEWPDGKGFTASNACDLAEADRDVKGWIEQLNGKPLDEINPIAVALRLKDAIDAPTCVLNKDDTRTTLELRYEAKDEIGRHGAGLFWVEKRA